MRMLCLSRRGALALMVLLGWARMGFAAEPQAATAPASAWRSRDAVLENVRAALLAVVKLRDQARQERDVVRLNCVDQKVRSMQRLLSLAEETGGNSERAAEAQEAASANVAQERLRLVGSKMAQLHAQAAACVGALIAYVGDTRVEVNTDPKLWVGASDPLSAGLQVQQPSIISERPPLATPY